jgi:hypothetical protein
VTSEEKELQELEHQSRELTTKEKELIEFITANKAELWRKVQERGSVFMTRDDFYPLMAEMLDNVKKKFNQKNKSYGQESDLFYNFRRTAKRVMQSRFESEYEDMYRTMLAYQDKHRVALANLGLDEPEFEERCLDEIVYTLLAIALHREYEKKVFAPR